MFKLKSIYTLFCLFISLFLIAGCGETAVENDFKNAAGLNKEETAQAVKVLESIGVTNIQEVSAYPIPDNNNTYAVTTDKYNDILCSFDGNKKIVSIETFNGTSLYETDANGKNIMPNKLDEVYISKSDFNTFTDFTTKLVKQRMNFPDSAEFDYGGLNVVRVKDTIYISGTVTGDNAFGMKVKANFDATYAYSNPELKSFNIDN